MPQGYDPSIRVDVALELHEAMALLILCSDRDDPVISDEGMNYTVSMYDAVAAVLAAMGRATGESSWLDQAAALRAMVDQAAAGG